MARYLVIIARDRPDLWLTWTAFYGGGVTVEVLCDRRQGQTGTGRGDGPERRARPKGDTELEQRGFLVIPRPDHVGASR